MQIENCLKVSNLQKIKELLKNNGVLEEVKEDSQTAELFGMRIMEVDGVPENEIWYTSHGRIIKRFVFKK